MPINLSKGQKVDLTKGNASLKHIMVGLGWDVNAFDSGSDFDLDASAFMCGANGKCPTEKEFVFYGNLEHPSGAVKHQGDNLTGEGDGDDEQIFVDLKAIPESVDKTEKCVHNCVNKHIGIRMTEKSEFKGNLCTADYQLSVLGKFMHIISVTDSHINLLCTINPVVLT